MSAETVVIISGRFNFYEVMIRTLNSHGYKILFYSNLSCKLLSFRPGKITFLHAAAT